MNKERYLILAMDDSAKLAMVGVATSKKQAYEAFALGRRDYERYSDYYLVQVLEHDVK